MSAPADAARPRPPSAPLPAPLRLLERQQRLQERAWVVERWGWVAMAGFVALAAAGGFGDGPVAHARAEAADGSLEVVYERFQRTEAGTSFALTAPVGRLRDGRLTVCLDRGMMENWQVARIEPGGGAESLNTGGLCVSAALAPAPGEARTPPLTLFVRPHLLAFPARGTLALPGGAPVAVAAVIWP